MTRATPIYAADFETTTDPNDCRVWGAGVANIERPDRVTIVNTLEKFLDLCKRNNNITYFHNMKFDGMFILDYLLKHGFTHVEGEYALRENEFSSLISKDGKFYEIRVKWETGNLTRFRDSFKKLPMSIEAIARSYQLPMLKGSIDYDAPRPVTHVITEDEKRYIHNDVAILANALKIAHDEGMRGMTTGSDALKDYRKTKGKTFNTLFPVLDIDTDAFIRRAYRGGFTYRDPRYIGVECGAGNVYDVNSLYPSIMYDKQLPYGLPEYVPTGRVEPTENYPLCVQSVTFVAKLKRDHIPCIQIKGSSIFAGTEYLSEIEAPTTLMVTDVDWSLYNDHYDITVLSFNGGYRFRAATGMFKDYIDHWSKIKRESTGGRREIAKLFLNSLYGKFATNPDITGKIPYLKDNVVAFMSGTPQTRDPVYTPIGVYVTAYGRDVTIRAAQDNYTQFAYADTDSLHLIGPPATRLHIDPEEFGAWKHEYAFKRARFVRAKAYAEQEHDGTMHVHIAGLPRDAADMLTIDDLAASRVIDGKLRPKTVPGGVVLLDTPFTLAV